MNDRRRRILQGLAACAWPLGAAAQPAPAPSHDPFGPVKPPVPAPPMTVVTHLGESIEMARLLAGKVTALQLMFTGCSATCPIQGSIFAAARNALGSDVRDAAWLSFSIDPLSDDPPALARWLARYGGGPGWTALRPRPNDLDRMLDFLDGRPKRPGTVDRHVGQAFLFDRRGQLVFRTVEMPPPAHVADLMRQIDRMG